MHGDNGIAMNVTRAEACRALNLKSIRIVLAKSSIVRDSFMLIVSCRRNDFLRNKSLGGTIVTDMRHDAGSMERLRAASKQKKGWQNAAAAEKMSGFECSKFTCES